MTSRRRLPPEKRRAQLLSAAEAVFAREGFGGARLDDVARAAGVSPGLLSQYWPGGKAELYGDVRRRIRDENVAAATVALEQRPVVGDVAPTTAEQVVTVVDALVRWHHGRVDAWRLLAPEPQVPVDADDDLSTLRALVPGAAWPEGEAVVLGVSRGIAQAFRSGMEAMHRDGVDPAIASVTLSLFCIGILDAACAALGGRLDGADDAYAHAAVAAAECPGDPVAAARLVAERGWPPLRVPAEPPPWQV